MEGYVKLEDLFVYKISMELCDSAWKIYELFQWQDKKIIGDQFITAVDSVAANVAEGYGRYHYLDRIKFYYNARASLLETKYWIQTLHKRNMIDENKFEIFVEKLKLVHYQVNN